jgi:hypothetical protein
MQISLQLRLDATSDRFVIKLEGSDASNGPRTEQLVPVEGLPEPVALTLAADGTIEEIGIPGLSMFLKAIAGGGK